MKEPITQTATRKAKIMTAHDASSGGRFIGAIPITGRHTRSAPLWLLAPSVCITGGIEAAMRRMGKIASRYCGSQRRLSCLSLRDQLHPRQCEDDQIDYQTLLGAEFKKHRYVVQAFRLAYQERPELAIIGHVGLLPLAWALKKSGLLGRYVLMVHGREAWVKLPRIDRLCLKNADAIASYTRYTARVFGELNGVDVERISIIPLALSDADWDYGEGPEPSLEGRPAHVLSVGRLDASEGYKGFDLLIDAVAQALQDGTSIRLMIAGSGSDLPRLRARAESAGVSGSVDFLLEPSNSELHRLYQDCDIFALPSREEGFGIVFLEAMRYAKPCIGGNHGGTPEVIDHGRDGFLVKHGDVNQLTKCLVTLATSPELRSEMGRLGQTKVVERFRFENMQRNWFRLLDELLL